MCSGRPCRRARSARTVPGLLSRRRALSERPARSRIDGVSAAVAGRGRSLVQAAYPLRGISLRDMPCSVTPAEKARARLGCIICDHWASAGMLPKKMLREERACAAYESALSVSSTRKSRSQARPDAARRSDQRRRDGRRASSPRSCAPLRAGTARGHPPRRRARCRRVPREFPRDDPEFESCQQIESTHGCVAICIESLLRTE